MAADSSGAGKGGRGSPFAWLALCVFAGMVFFMNLGEPGMYAPQEGRAGIIVRNMVESGDYLDLQFKGRDTNEKPVLFYWLCLGGAKIFGFNEFGIRFPSALAAFASALGAAALGRRIYGDSAGLLSGFILASMLSFVNLGRIARIDMALGAFYLWAMYLLYRGYFENMRANWRLYAFYAVLGLSVLLKGPVSAALAGFGALLFAAAMRNWRVLWELKPLSGLGIGLLVSGPWFVYQGMRTGGEYTTQFFFSHNVERFLGLEGIYGGGDKKPLLFYVPNLLAGAMPWTLILPFGLWEWWRRRKASLRPQTWFLLTWFASVFIFFSLSAYKRGDYLTPLYPCAAILLARAIVAMREEGRSLPRAWLWSIWGGLAALSCLLLAAVRSGLAARVVEPCLSDKVPFVSERDAQSALQMINLADSHMALLIFGLALALLALFLVCHVFQRGRILLGAYLIATGCLLLHLANALLIQPSMDKYKTLREHVVEYAKIVPKGALVCHCRVENLEEIAFYLDRDYEELWKTKGLIKPDRSLAYEYLVIRASTFDKELDASVKAKYEVVSRTRKGHQYPTVFCVSKGAAIASHASSSGGEQQQASGHD